MGKKKNKSTEASQKRVPTASSTPENRLKVHSWYDKIIVVLICVLWLIPILFVGTAKTNSSRYLGTYLGNLHRVACLFTRSVRVWKSYHVEIQTSKNPEWHEMQESQYFDMPVFGYRTRLHRMLGQSHGRTGGEKRIMAITRFIHKRYQEINGPDDPLVAIRYVRVAHSIPQLAAEEGRFQKPLLIEVQASRKSSFGEFRFEPST
jgi:hypothetical protein